MKKIAVITGASSGMGREFVLQLDNSGFDEIWGIALDMEGLEETQKMIKTPFKKLAYDLTEEKSFKEYVELLKSENPQITWLANCSGYCKFGDYSQIPLSQSVNMVELNCLALVKITELTLPYMPNGSIIVQIASMAGLQSTPYMNCYGASKAFVLSYSRGLNMELKPREISVTCMCPLWTNTNFQKVARATSETAVKHISSSYSAQKVVTKGIKDARKRKVVSLFGAKSHFQRALVKLLPHSWIVAIWSRQQKK